MRLSSLNELLKRHWLVHTNLKTEPHLPSSIGEFIKASKYPSSLCGLDLGKEKTGIAVSIGDQPTAIPFGTVATVNLQHELSTLKQQRIPSISGLVIGFPVALNGRIEVSAVKRSFDAIRVFAQFLSEYQIPVWFHDERYTTIQSHTQIHKKHKKRSIDDLSAMIILQEVLDVIITRQSPKSQGHP